MKQSVAFFDFDGTITTKDTLLEFLKFSRGSARFYLGFGLNSPWLVAYKAKLISNQLAKEKVLSFFFRNMPIGKFQEHCESFSSTSLPALIRPKALQEIETLRSKDVKIVIVSASPENWIRTWASSIGADLIATRLQTSGDRLTGRIQGKNCYGEEKVNRIRENYNLNDYSSIYAYGDTSGDKPMLNLAQHQFYKPFR